MKILFIFAIFLLSLQAAKANYLTDPSAEKPSLKHSKTTLKNNTDTTSVQIPAPGQLDSGENVFAQRLDSITKDIPLNYNEYVQNYINLFLNDRDEMEHVLGLSRYYFPIYEKVFRDAGVPTEIKYLSIVESKLDPNAVSKAGATGPWQFMYNTAKLYGLNMNSYVDERRDPVQASYAAAAYLKSAYEEFGDWLLAIASYNCGTSDVEYAIQKSGANDFWSIRKYLPVETRNYVPAFIAVAYVMNYYSKHGLVPQPCSFAANMDTVLVDKFVSLDHISSVLNIDPAEMAILNPAYKRHIINGTSSNPCRLIIPQPGNGQYAALYNALNVDTLLPVAYNDEQLPRWHRVRRGETLASIADRYGVDEHDLKTWNHLRHNKAVVGEKLRLTAYDDEGRTERAKHSRDYITYKVKRGDTLSVIASKFDGVSVSKIKSINGLRRTLLQPGMILKISRG